MRRRGDVIRVRGFGALRLVKDLGGAVTVFERDVYGRVRELIDPDRGTTTTHYSGFGLVLP